MKSLYITASLKLEDVRRAGGRGGDDRALLPHDEDGLVEAAADARDKVGVDVGDVVPSEAAEAVEAAVETTVAVNLAEQKENYTQGANCGLELCSDFLSTLIWELDHIATLASGAR